MTINKKVLVLMVVLLAALSTSPAMADLVTPMPNAIFDINNNAYTGSQSVNYGNYPSLTEFNNRAYYCTEETYNRMHSIVTESFTVNLYVVNRVISGGLLLDEIVYTVNCIGAPEPTPTPTSPYLKASVMVYDVTFVTYQITTEPDDQGYEFSRITTTPQDTQFTNPQWSPAQSIIYSIPRGETITFYSKVKSWFNSGTLSLSITAPKGQEDNIINETAPEVKPNNTAYNPPPIPHVTPGSKDNPVNSGKFKPSNSNSNYITPFTQFTENVKEFMQLPQMDNPQKIKSEILNTTGGNLTAPLYESIDGFTNLLCFPAYFVSDSLNAALSPIEEAINYCDDVLIVILGSVSEFFLSIDTLKSFFYLLIPDFVWWIICTILIFDIIATIMSFIYGRSITFYYLFGFNDKKD